MLNQDYTTKLLDMEEVIITNIEREEDSVHLYLEIQRKEHTCPCCGASTSSVHDYRWQKIKHIPLGCTTYFHLRKRRYRCNNCGKRFAEKNSFLPRYYRMTSKLIAEIIEAFHKTVSASEVAQRFNISSSTALRIFDCVSYKCNTLPRVVSLDEFKGNAGKQKYQSIVTDPEHKKILDILPDRYESTLIRYFKSFPSRFDVQYFITDMNPHFREVGRICFPNAAIIADKYHVTRQAVWAMERVRKAEQAKLPDRHRKYFKHSRYLLMKRFDKLTDEEKNMLALMFEIAPRLADAYRVKNEFLKVMRSGSSAEGRKAMLMWIQSVEVMDLPEFNDCTRACRNWFHEILNSFDVPWTNGFTEGCNNKTKVLKRICYGVRNFARFRNRILHCSTYKSVGA